MLNKCYKIINLRNNQEIISNAEFAQGFSQRFFGLMGKEKIDYNFALIFSNCKIVHSFFMKCSIDLIFCNKTNEVIFLQKNFKPWKISKFSLNADYIIELASGRIESLDLRVGDRLDFSK